MLTLGFFRLDGNREINTRSFARAKYFHKAAGVRERERNKFLELVRGMRSELLNFI